MKILKLKQLFLEIDDNRLIELESLNSRLFDVQVQCARVRRLDVDVSAAMLDFTKKYTGPFPLSRRWSESVANRKRKKKMP